MLSSHSRRAGAYHGNAPCRKGWGKRAVARHFRRWTSNRLRRRFEGRDA